MEQEHVDQLLGARDVAAGLAGGSPERVVGGGERPRGSGLGQDGRAGERAGLVAQNLEVVVQLDPGHPTRAEAGMGGDHGAALEHDHARGPQNDPDALPDQVRRNGVLDHAHGDQGGAVDARVEDQAGVEVIGRQRRQVVEFGAVVLPDRVRMAGDPAGVVVDFPDTDLVVEFVQARCNHHTG